MSLLKRIVIIWNIIILSQYLFVKADQGLTTGEAIMKCNEYYRNTGNYASLPNHIRWAAIFNLAIHNAINSINPHYQTFRNVSYNISDYNGNHNHGHISEVSSVLGVFNIVKKFAIENDLFSNTNFKFFNSTQQASQISNLNNFINNLKNEINDNHNNINNGYNFGIKVGQDLLNAQALDGWNTTVPPIMGIFPYQPGQWYTAVFSDGVTYANGTNDFTSRGALYPNWSIVKTMGIPSSNSTYVPPRPALNTIEFLQNYQETFNCGNLSNLYGMRTPFDESDTLAMVISASQLFINKMTEEIINNNINVLTNYDISYIYALSSLALHDSAVHNTYWKTFYNYDRPIQLIFNGGGTLYPNFVANTNWKFFRNGAPNQEYPCAHCENTGAGLEGIRLALIGVGLIDNSNSILNDTIPGGAVTICEGVGTTSCLYPMTVGKFNEFKDRVIRARVCGGMHYHVSGQVGKHVGEQIALYEYQHHLIKNRQKNKNKKI